MFPLSDYYLPAEMAYRRERITTNVVRSNRRRGRSHAGKAARRRPTLRPAFVIRKRVA